MTITNVTTDNLGINVLGYSEYDNISTKSNKELYVVKNTNADSDNSISSRTYADVGRYAVHYGNTAPTSEFAKIWVDTSQEPVLIMPASVDMDNLTATGAENLQTLVSPNFAQITNYSQSAGSSFTLPSTGWLYIFCDNSSSIELKKDDNTGIDLVSCTSTVDTKCSDHLLLEKGTVVYVNTRSGTVVIEFIPCKGSI